MPVDEMVNLTRRSDCLVQAGAIFVQSALRWCSIYLRNDFSAIFGKLDICRCEHGNGGNEQPLPPASKLWHFRRTDG